MSKPISKPAKKIESQLLLTDAQKKMEEYLAGWQRAKADYENLRQRTEAQRSELIKTATQELVGALLPIVDNLELALKHASKDTTLRNGVQLIHKQLREVLAGQGVEIIRAVRQSFDPAVHEAVAHVAGTKNICVSEHAPGYKLHGKVLRPARVSVGNGQPAHKP